MFAQVVTPPATHGTLGSVHVERHIPIVQTWPVGHVVPHTPQFALSVCVSVHVAVAPVPQRV